MVFSGTTASNASSAFFESASEIVSYSLVNNTGGALTITAGVLYGSTVVLFYSGVISANSSFTYTGDNITVLGDYRIIVTTSGAGCDYYFSIK